MTPIHSKKIGSVAAARSHEAGPTGPGLAAASCSGSVLDVTRHVLGDPDQVVHDRRGGGLDLVYRHQVVGDLAPEVRLVGPGGPETTGGGACVRTCVLVCHRFLLLLSPGEGPGVDLK